MTKYDIPNFNISIVFNIVFYCFFSEVTIFASSIKEIKKDLCELNLFAYELSAGKVTELDTLLKEPHKSISVIIGPEGGFDSSEADFLINEGFKNISLGKRILRCETAAVYALSVIAFNLEK